jgi:ribosome-binding factor A
MKNYNRSDRVGDLIRQEVANFILHGEIKDPRVGFVTITGVKMSRDMKNARVFFSMIGSPEEIAESEEGLNSASGFIRRFLARQLNLKRIPEIKFSFDDSLEYSSHIEEVLKDIKKDS